MQRIPAAIVLACAAILCGSYCCANAQTTANAAETQEIAKEAYEHGFPMVAVYLRMHAFSIDKDNSQYKGPFGSVPNFASTQWRLEEAADVSNGHEVNCTQIMKGRYSNEFTGKKSRGGVIAVRRCSEIAELAPH